MEKKPTIPRLPHAFFKWYCQPAMYEEMHGDLEEFFYERAAEKGLFKARLLYLWDVLRCFQPYAWRRPTAPTNAGAIMFRNYFKISLRSLMKNPLNSFINVFGLSVAIGIAVFVYAFANWTFSTDQFHEHKNEVFLVTFLADRDGTPQEYGTTPRPLGAMLREDFTHIDKVCRVEDRPVVIKYGDEVYHERVRYADPEFLDMFTFPLKLGNKASLADPNSIVLSENMAEKYFGKEDPLGKEVLVKFDHDNGKLFKVTGVAAKFPASRTISFDFLLNFDNLQTLPDYNVHDWSSTVAATFIQVDDPFNITSIEPAMEKYKAMQNSAVQPDWAITSFAFRPLATLHETSEHIKDGVSRSSRDNYMSIMFMSIVAVLMLALACLNYINIAIVSATKRLKEIGIRKTIGATRGTVVVQFLSENVLITFFAMLLGIALALGFFIRGFEGMWGFDMDFRFTDTFLWIFLPAILLLTSLASGIYPALYISRFQVVNIIKGTVRFGKKNTLTRVFLALQLVFACVFITSAVTFTQNSAWLGARSWGYSQHEVLYTGLPDAQAFTKLRDALSSHPDIVSISGSFDHLGRSEQTAVLHFPDRQYEAMELKVDARYFETMGLQLVEGRTFRENAANDQQGVVLNATLAASIAPGVPASEVPGLSFDIDSTRYEVVGVVADFHAYDLSNKIKPAFFSLADKDDYHYLTLKAKPGTEKAVYEALQGQWATLFPETPFMGGYQEDVWGFYYEVIDIHAIVWQVVATMAILLAGLGLYGLISLNVVGRIREFSIRKVLGARLTSIAANITRRYAVLFAVALLLGAPLSYKLMNILFDAAYTYHMPIGFSGVAVAVFVLIGVLLFTVGIQVARLRKFNPVNGLRVE
jgi:putative ABC transport system permease protein